MFFLIVSCNKKEVVKNGENFWDEIRIENNNKEIIIYNETDTASFRKANYEKIKLENGSTNYRLKKIEKSTFKLSKSERDTIHKIVREIITNPVFTDKSATCYAGNVLISLKNSHTTLTCQYNSVGTWSEVSKKTKKLYNLLKSKVEISK